MAGAGARPTRARRARQRLRQSRAATRFNDGGGRPAKDFYQPTETAPETDFGRGSDEGYLIVEYRPDLPANQLSQLRAFITGPEGARVVGRAVPDQADPLLAQRAYQTMTCPDFNLAALKSLTRSWLSDNGPARPVSSSVSHQGRPS